ncbi:excisionase family DNA-binding protein [Georgenia sp. TF02-10]|uniref:excisionase family DNA-binding protein n=1 Tax=Georgenia sp. TF02-10 TaxID=2917725 RepID=UPI001FA6DA19|nr:excisionase family DNA-binding protein [Georgenia sp. TF02-10]UNX55665.1 excisionase family DNA-binding protein [Georgenia sp. TF02-10]
MCIAQSPGGMPSHSITITPEDVHASAGRAGARPGWLDEIADYVRRAASEGEQVTLTAKRRMMTPAQVAEAMGVSRSTISRKITAGELRAVRVGNRNRIPYEEFRRFWQQTMGDVIELTRDDIRTDLLGG